MKSLKDEIDQLELSTPVQFRNLTLFPILRNAVAIVQREYLLLEDAVLNGLARVTELSDGGSVPELRFENNAEQPVLLLDGEELLGAKQNRVLNLTILAPPKQSIVIPVSCVEAGRWHMESTEFKPAAQLMYSRARAARTGHVTDSMRASGTRRSDQSALWDEIALKACRVEAPSPTRAMSAMYERHAHTVEEYARAFAWRDRQAGIAFAIGGQVLGFDLFDQPITMRRVFPKVVRSYALDALDAMRNTTGAANEGATEQRVAELMTKLVSAPSFAQSAVGLGKDVRVAGNLVSGAALWAEDRYIHVCAFATSGTSENRPLRTRLSRPSRRGMY